MEDELKSYRSELGVERKIVINAQGEKEVLGGTAGVATSDIPSLESKVFKDASRNARINVGPAEQGKFQSPNSINSDHSEQGLVNQLHNEIEQLKLTPNQLEGKTVRIHVEQAVCSTCRQGLDNPNADPGVLKQFSEKYKGLRIIVTAENTDEVLIIQGGRRIN